MGDAPMDHTKECYCTPSWVFGYFAIAQLPLTIVGPINATRPVMTLVGAMLVFGERLNAWQWVGVSLAIISLFLLARSGKREGIDFKHNKWIFFLVLAAMMGTCSGLLDKYLMASPENGGVGLDRMMAQSWYNIYQCIMMGVVLLVYIFNQRRKQSVQPISHGSGLSCSYLYSYQWQTLPTFMHSHYQVR